MFKKRKGLWWTLIGLVLLIFVIKIGKNNDDGIKVAIEKADTHTIIESVSASGKIYPETELKISPEVSGEIIELNVAEGDSVHKGQVLLKINPAIYSSQVEQAEAAVEQSKSSVVNAQEVNAQTKANYEQALANYNRNKKLFQDKVISATEFEQFEATFKSSKATYEASLANIKGGKYGVKASAANLTQARANLLKTTIVAPQSGIISSLPVKKGERVLGTSQMQGTQVLTIADMSRMELRVDVSETDITHIKLGDTGIISADAYRNKKFTGVVSKISVASTTNSTSNSSDQVTNYTVSIWILPESYADIAVSKNFKYPFKPGMSASVEIQTQRLNQALSVPVNAVTTRDWPDSLKDKDQIRQVVFVYQKDQKNVVVRDVETGIQDNQYIEIIKGLKKGEEVVIAPYGAIARLLNDKDKVQVTKKELLFENKEK